MTQWGLDTLFNPAKRHMDEEKRRLQATREEVGDSSGGKRIDLESGKVTIARPTKEAAADETAEMSEADDGTAQQDSSDATDRTNDAAPADRGSRRHNRRAPTPAQIRAARRRGRDIG